MPAGRIPGSLLIDIIGLSSIVRAWRRDGIAVAAKSVQTHCMEENEGRTFLRKLFDDRRFAARVAFWLVIVAVWSVLQSLRRFRLMRARYIRE